MSEPLSASAVPDPSDGDAQSIAPPPPGGPYPMFTMGILATVAMLFAAFSAALLVRRAGTDWLPVSLPPIIWLNTAGLILSSAALERSRALIRRDAVLASARYLMISTALGTTFLVGQVIAWRQLAVDGVFLSTGPHAAFFYLLSGVHGAHIVGGLVALSWTLARLRRGTYTPASHAGLTHASIYWHFVGAVWFYLLLVLTLF